MPKTLTPHKPYNPYMVIVQDSPSDSSSDFDSDSDPSNCRALSQ